MSALQWRERWAGSPRKRPAAQTRSSLGQRMRGGGNTQRSDKDRAAAWVRMRATGSLVTLDVFPKHLLSSHCPQFSPANPAGHCLPHRAAHIKAFLLASPRDLPSNKGVQSWRWVFSPTSNCRFQKHGTQESDTKALGNCIYTLLSPQTFATLPAAPEGENKN